MGTAVAAFQNDLAEAGFYDGRRDGIWNAETHQAALKIGRQLGDLDLPAAGDDARPFYGALLDRFGFTDEAAGEIMANLGVPYVSEADWASMQKGGESFVDKSGTGAIPTGPVTSSVSTMETSQAGTQTGTVSFRANPFNSGGTVMASTGVVTSDAGIGKNIGTTQASTDGATNAAGQIQNLVPGGNVVPTNHPPKPGDRPLTTVTTLGVNWKWIGIGAAVLVAGFIGYKVWKKRQSGLKGLSGSRCSCGKN